MLTLSGARCPGTSEPATLGNTQEKQTLGVSNGQAGSLPRPPSPLFLSTGILLHFRTTPADTCLPVPAVALPLPQQLHAPEASCPHCGSKYSPQALIVHAVRAPGVGVGLSDDLVLIQQIHAANWIGARTGVKLVMCEAQW